MASTELNFINRGLHKRPYKPRKPFKLSCGIIVIALISSLIFGFIGGILGLYVLVGKDGLKSAQTGGLDLIGKKTYKVTEQSAIIDVAKKVSPSVVSITATTNIQDLFGNTQEQQSSGSGFIITSDGLIMTNKHVASNISFQYTVLTTDGKAYKAKVITVDPLNDLAILKISATGLAPVALGDSDELQVGQRVIAIGNALNFQNTVTNGIISAKERTIEAGDTSGQTQKTLEGLIQTDAAINSGNSGGPLINLDGQVVGINTAVAEKGVAEGIGFAIPVNIAKSAIESYKKQGTIVRPFIGVRYMLLTSEIAKQNNLSSDTGAWLNASQGQAAIVLGSPADKAGLKSGDILTEINGEKIDKDHSLSRLIQQYQPGNQVEITYIRDGKTAKVKVKLGKYEK